jgi:hypothetical protein
LKRFEAQLTEVFMEHERLTDKMHGDFEVEKSQLEREKINLSEKIESMLKDHKHERENTENEKWEEIEQLKEKNKEELADRIDKGMQEKAALTLINNDLQQRNNKKKGLQNKIDKMDNDLKDEMN